MKPIPDCLRAGPFSRSHALSLGVTPQMLRSHRFSRVYPRVWRVTDLPMTDKAWVRAAALALPAHAHLTGISLIQQLGLDFGPQLPVRFVIEGDHHVAFDNVFLHRTVKLPPLGEHGVSVEAAYLSYLTQARVIDAIEVGDWLLHEQKMDLGSLRALALAQPWRDGAVEALWILEFLDGRSRSLKESETRALLEFAGLTRPEVNHELAIDGRTVIGDLVYVAELVVVEYEGDHHQEDRLQYTSDIDRYADLRRSPYSYLQVTREHLKQPRAMVRRVHAELVTRGYTGPAPLFGDRWRQLFSQVAAVVPRQPGSRSRSA